MLFPMNILKQTDEEIFSYVHNRVDEMAKHQKNFHDEWKYAEDCVGEVNSKDDLHEGVNISLSRMIIEYALAEESNAFSNWEYYELDRSERHIATMVNAAKDDVLEKNMWDNEAHRVRRARRVYGIGTVFVRYEYKEIETSDLDMVETLPDGTQKETWVDSKEVEDGIKITAITDPRTFYLDPAALDVHEAEDCALRSTMTKAQFENLFPEKKYPNAKDVSTRALNDSADSFDVLVGNPKSDNGSSQEMVDVYYYWNKELKVFVILAGKTILYKSKMPYWHQSLPFATMHMYRRPNTFYSMGVPKVLEYIEIPYNEMVKETVRAAKLTFPVLTTESGSMVSMHGIEHYPGMVLEGMKDKISLQALGSVPGEVYQLIDELKKQAILATGVNFEQVYDTKSDRVGIEALKKESQLLLINANIRQNEQVFLGRLGYLLERTIQQSYPVPRIKEITPAEVDSVDSVDQREYDGRLYKLEYRQVRITDLLLTEKKSSDGSMMLSQDTHSGKGYFPGRPEYLRSRSPLLTRIVRPSAMGGSKEAKKLAAQELLSIASDVNALEKQNNPEAAPIFNLQGIGRIIAELSEFPVDRILVQPSEKTSAQEAVKKILTPMQELFTQTQTFPQQNAMVQDQQTATGSGNLPPITTK